MNAGTRYKNGTSDSKNKHTEKLMRQNENLTHKISLLEKKLAQYVCNKDLDNPRRSVELDTLRRQSQQNGLDTLRLKMKRVETENCDLINKCKEADKRNSSLACLYVTSYQLHSSLDFEQVMQTIREVVINLIGSECFGIYMFDSLSKTFVLASGRGLEDKPKIHNITYDDSLVSPAVDSCELYIGPESSKGSFDHPVAVAPLLAPDEMIGLLIIYKLLVQKEGFELIDIELLNLLGSQAGIAIKAAQIYSLMKADD